MDDLVERTRAEIRKQGYKTATRIKIELSQAHSIESVSLVLSLLECEDIKRIEYTNDYVAKYTTKDMYYYNPRKNKIRRKRGPSKRKAQGTKTKS